MLIDSCIDFLDELNDIRLSTNRETLVSLISLLNEKRSVDMIRVQTQSTRVSDKCDVPVLCIIMLSCEAYGLSNRICATVLDTMFAILWDKIEYDIE